VLASLLAGVALAHADPTFVGEGTLDNPNDLTIIYDDHGYRTDLSVRYEFLDLTPTYKLPVSVAVSRYSERGFTFATGYQVAKLFTAFNIGYGVNVVNPQPHQAGAGVWYPNADPRDTARLAKLLGHYLYDPFWPQDPNIFTAMGWIDDEADVDGFHTYACISNCYNDTFISRQTAGYPEVGNNDYDAWHLSTASQGTFLVRAGLPGAGYEDVPEPGVLSLVGIGLIGMYLRRRGKA